MNIYRTEFIHNTTLNPLYFNFQTNLQAFQKLGKKISYSLKHGYFDKVIKQQSVENKWFTEINCRFALEAIAKMVDAKSCDEFYIRYKHYFQEERKSKKIAVISAGNIPCAAFHDFFCVIASGNQYVGKLSKQDALLLPVIAKMLIIIAPELSEKIVFVDKLNKFDKIIATGSNNSTRYFEYYFKDYPKLLRKNRNSIAILTGRESEADLQKLSSDIFLYFGLGCRSVSKIYVPKDYNFNLLVQILHKESKSLMLHTGYANNYDYHRAIYALNKKDFFDGNSFLLIQNSSVASPISVIYYEVYENIYEISTQIQLHEDDIQCLVSGDFIEQHPIFFGETQRPSLFDYPDKKDILLFCIS
ncbi:MAG: hypothetical protein LBU83_02020 [Bacteroidales bacterium]|jgi:hypothetical protein|nr:hypothetical protein [Bacteroidales bacterium]